MYVKTIEEKKLISNFLVELTELSKKYGIIILGCGCCESPSLYYKEQELDGEEFIKGKYIRNREDDEIYSSDAELVWLCDNEIK